MTPVRVGLIGARRARQGLGPFVARELRAAGAEVPCFLSTRAETREEAAAQLARGAGVRARGYLRIDAMLEAERLDALAICSPHATHRVHLDTALGAGLHVLCEKPLLWGGTELSAHAARLAAGFETRKLQLWENCQWPYALPAFERLHPGSLATPPRRFAMELQPSGSGPEMLADSLPHALSLLQRLAPEGGAQLADVRFPAPASEAGPARVRFVYAAGTTQVDTEITLRPTLRHPRQTRLEIDGHRARRLVSRRDYRLAFEDAGRQVELEDPLRLLVRDFVRSVEADDLRDSMHRHREIVERMRLLEEIASAYARAPSIGAQP